MNSETFKDLPRILLLLKVQGDCRQFFDKPDFQEITVDSPKWELLTAQFKFWVYPCLIVDRPRDYRRFYVLSLKNSIL